MKLKRCHRRGPSRFWALAHRIGAAKMRMPFWRVIVECQPMIKHRGWPVNADLAVTGVFVWARTSEEAEGLAMLALEDEGMAAGTADARKEAPSARPRKQPAALARTGFVYLPRFGSDQPLSPPPRRGAKA